jgi:3-hydroxyacyl-[acyl-carrier-protein] dehydratase
MRKSKDNLGIGTNVVELLLPHRRPLLMVDTVDAFRPGEEPALVAGRHVSANEGVFDGHFPTLNLWPGIYTIEGMGQSCQLLVIIVEIRRRYEEGGADPDEGLRELVNLERGYTLHPGFDAGRGSAFKERLSQPDAGLDLGLSSSVDVKLLAPVFAGCRLTYEVRLTNRLENHLRFEVAASVEERIVARGSMTAVTGVPRSF